MPTTSSPAMTGAYINRIARQSGQEQHRMPRPIGFNASVLPVSTRPRQVNVQKYLTNTCTSMKSFTSQWQGFKGSPSVTHLARKAAVITAIISTSLASATRAIGPDCARALLLGRTCVSLVALSLCCCSLCCCCPRRVGRRNSSLRSSVALLLCCSSLCFCCPL